MKVIVFAFNHYDNVLSYTNAIAKYTDIKVTVVLVAHGGRLSTSSFDVDLKNYKHKLYNKDNARATLPVELQDFFEPKLRMWILKLAPKRATVKNVILSIWSLIDSALKTRKSFDVFHFNGVGLYSYLLSHFLKSRKRILTIHDFVSHSGEGNALISKSNHWLVNNFDHFIQHYDYLSKDMANYYKLPESQVHTVRSGTFEHFKQMPVKLPEISNYILFFGRIAPYKGLKYLVEAFIKYSKDFDGLDLVIAGGGDTSDIKERIAQEPRIHLLNNRIPIDELIGLIKGCQYVVCPYTDVTHSAVVAVAYTFRKPVLAHDIGGLSEVVFPDSTGLLFKDLQPRTIVEGIVAMNDLLKGKTLIKDIERLTERGILSWENIAQDYYKVYSKVWHGQI